MTTTINKPIQTQITQAIKYIKSQFPPQYDKWKQTYHGQKQFQSHLNVIEYMFSIQVYKKLRGKILDELLIKLRFFSINQSYLMKFQSYLLEKFIKFVVKGMKMVYDLEIVFNISNKDIALMKQKQKQRRQISQRYSILLQCLINILKYCFNQNKLIQHKKSQQQSTTSFMNQLINKSQQNNNIQIISREFINFIIIILEQKIDEIFKYKIINIKQIYPMLFSTLTQGLLTFIINSGSKFVEIVGRVIVKLVDQNKQNVWLLRDGYQIQKSNNQIQKLKALNKQVIEIITNKHYNNQPQQQNISTKNNEIIQKTFSTICKQRLLLFLQKLLTTCGYLLNINLTNNQKQQQQQDKIIIDMYHNNNRQGQCYGCVIGMSANRMLKMSVFVNRLLEVVVGRWFCMVGNGIINRLVEITQIDNHIMLCLVLLSIQFTCQQQQKHMVINQQEVNNPSYLSYSSYSSPQTQTQTLSLPQFFTYLSNTNISQQQQQSLSQTITFIKFQLYKLFMSKFKLLINKNKTISTQKTLLLKQLNKLVKYVTFQRMQMIEFVDMICIKLKQLFRPNQQDMNKPLIIAIDDNNRLQGTIIGQAIPLTPLQPYHSFTTYPITLIALKQSLKFQQTRHILDEIRVFQWFQHQQINLKLFRQLITSFDFNSKLLILQYFLQQLIKIKVSDGDNFYNLQMSLTTFYQVLILQFYIDTLLLSNTQQTNGILNFQVYQKNKQLYQKSILTKLQMLYSLIVSNIDMKKLLISNKQEELLVFLSLRIMYNINSFFYVVKIKQYQKVKSSISRISLLHSKMIIAENLILYSSHQTYLLQLLLTTYFIEFSAPNTIAQTLKPIQSTLIHRNAGSTQSNKQCNLQFIKNLIKLTKLQPKQAQQLAQIYLSKDFITNKQANSVISLLFPFLTPQTMRKCLLSIKNWPIIFLNKHNIQLLSNQPLMQQPKQSLFHANDNDNVTVSNALGVIVLQLGDKWVVQFQFKNPRKQILIDAMINLITVNNELIFWKIFFFENILPKLVTILKQIENFIDDSKKDQQGQQKGRRILLYERIHSKIYQLFSLIPVQNYKYSTQINPRIRQNLQQLKQIVQKQYTHLKRQCFVHQRYQYLDKYKQANALLQKIDTGLKYKQDQVQIQKQQN